MAILGSTLALAACAPGPSQHGFGGVRTVFHNPYAALELANGPVGPDVCEDQQSTDQCWLNGLLYPGRGQFAYDRQGNRVQLSRSDRRELRRRFELIRDQAEINRRVEAFNAMQANMPPVPAPNAPPIAASVPAHIPAPPISQSLDDQIEP